MSVVPSRRRTVTEPSRAMRRVWVVSVNMGYGHERAAYGLRHLASNGILTANDYPGIPKRDRELWKKSRRLYETISRLKTIPVVGNALFGLLDAMQRIPPFYPRRDLSPIDFALRQDYFSMEHLGLLRHLIEHLATKPLPLVCTFFLPAFAAELFDYPGEIYVVICDADIDRVWAPRDPQKSRIKYFAPNGRVVERLKLYGVPEKNIYLTGFPLPKELIGGPDATILKKDLLSRLCNLDPNQIFIRKYKRTLEAELGANVCDRNGSHPLTLTFAIGGAGAQSDIALTALRSLRSSITQRRIRMRIVAGTNSDIANRFKTEATRLHLQRSLGTSLCIDVFPDRKNYFLSFSKILRTTDILWTKPSELSFYCGAGLPILMAPTVGSQEEFNRIWLQSVGAGMDQQDPRYVNEWLFDWIQSGGLARAAWNGYIEAPTHGAYRIESILTGEHIPLAKLPLIV